MNNEISNVTECEVYSPSRRKRPKMTRESESDSDEDVTDCDSLSIKKEVEELEEALLRKEAEIKDLNYELENERSKYEEYVASTTQKDLSNQQLISKQKEEIVKLKKDKNDLKNLVDYLKEENKNLNEILSATALGSARSLEKSKAMASAYQDANMIIPDKFSPVTIKKELPDPVEAQDYLELSNERRDEESLLPVLPTINSPGVIDEEVKIEPENAQVLEEVGPSFSTPSSSSAKPPTQPEGESKSDGNGRAEDLEFLTCRLCVFETNVKSEYDAHARLHVGVCDQCDFASPNAKELANHRFTKHNVINRHYLAKRSSEFNSRRLIRANDRPFKCDICEYSSKWQSSLNRHKEMHACGGFKCVLCDFSAATRNNLTKHEQIHARGRVFECDFCHASFKHRHRLLKHRQTHTGEKPFKCEECDYATSKKGNLIVHIRTHTNERPFSCQYCGYSFKVRSDLTRHVKRMHTGQRAKRGAPSKLQVETPNL